MFFKKKISIVSSCYNEVDNIKDLYRKVNEQIQLYKNKYDFEFIMIDNCSTDATQDILKELAKEDKNFKVIINSRNFGHIRSPFYGIVQGTGGAVIYLASDLQDPPELIGNFITKWEEGFKIVVGVKDSSQESKFMFFIRKIFYEFIKRISDDETQLIKNYTGFGLYDKKIIEIIKNLDDPYPYLRGLICEVGFEKALIEFHQPTRKKGITKNNFYTLYDNAMIGIVKHSKVPLRIMTFMGFILGFISLLVSIGYLVAKLMFWNKFDFGIAPLIISLFFFSSVQLFFMGVLGEYVGAIHTRVNKKPLVIEKERINF